MIKIFCFEFTIEQVINIVSGILVILSTTIPILYKLFRRKLIATYYVIGNTIDILIVNKTENPITVLSINKVDGKNSENLQKLVSIIKRLNVSKSITPICIAPFSSYKLENQSFKDMTFTKKTKILITTTSRSYKAKQTNKK